jgi:hypothetical protein
MVLSWLLQTLDQSIVNSILWMDLASDVWQNLRKRYCQGDLFRIAELQESLFAFKQGDLSITAYFTQLQGIWLKLTNFRPLPFCKCITPCSCDLLPTIQSYHVSDFVIRFLRGLNKQYTNVRSNIMLMDPLPDADKVFSLLI